MRAGPYTLQTAARRAGATGHVDPDTQTTDPDTGLRHCGRRMGESYALDGHTPLRDSCLTCATDVTHIDGQGAPASITPRQRRTLHATGELWTVGADPAGQPAGRGTAGTAQR